MGLSVYCLFWSPYDNYSTFFFFLSSGYLSAAHNLPVDPAGSLCMYVCNKN